MIIAVRKPWSSATPSGGNSDPLSTSAEPAQRKRPTSTATSHARVVGAIGERSTIAPAATATTRHTRTSTSVVGSPVTAGAEAPTATAMTITAAANASLAPSPVPDIRAIVRTRPIAERLPGNMGASMGLFKKILHAGEGRKLKDAGVGRARGRRVRARDAARVPTTSSARSPRRSGSRLDQAARRRRARVDLLDDLLPEAFAAVREAGDAHARPAPLRRADHGRCGAALRLGRRDEDRRGQDPRRHPAALPQRAWPGGGVAPRHRERLPGQVRDAEWMGQRLPVPRSRGRRRPPADRRLRRRSAPPTPPTSPTAPTTSSASTTCATTWPSLATTRCSAVTSSRSSTRSTRSSSTRRARR